MNNPLDQDFKMPQYIKPGVYRQVGNRVEFVKPGFTLAALRGEDTMLIMSRHGQGDEVEAGRRILKIMKQGKTIAKTGDLNAKAQATVAAVRKTFDLPE